MYQNENKGGNLNEKAKKEKRKYEISQKEKHDKKEKEEKLPTNESNLEKKFVVLESEKNEMIQQTENEDQNWKENRKTRGTQN